MATALRSCLTLFALATALSTASTAPALAQAPDSGPLRVVVLADTSQAMEPHIADMRQALRDFIREMNGAADIALVEFGERPARLVDYTRDPVRLDTGVGRLFARPGSGAYVLDAIVEASRELGAHETGRSAIVVISAQGPEFSNRYYRDVLQDLRTSRATLHSIVLTRARLPIQRDDVRERELTLSEGTAATGGSRKDLLTSMALGDTLRDLARELKTRPRVSTEPGAPVSPVR